MVLEPWADGMWREELGQGSCLWDTAPAPENTAGSEGSRHRAKARVALLWNERKVPLPDPEHWRLSAVVLGLIGGAMKTPMGGVLWDMGNTEEEWRLGAQAEGPCAIPTSSTQHRRAEHGLGAPGP